MILRIACVAALLAATAPLKAAMTFDNDPVPVIDSQRFAGKWYSLTSIPTFLDRKWLETVEYYTPSKRGFDVRTTYRKEGETKQREISSKLFLPKEGPMGALKAQFFWPVKVDYTILELAPDYSWMVGGSPDKKMLFILSRAPSLPAERLEQIIARCKEIGYATEELKSQEHPAGG